MNSTEVAIIGAGPYGLSIAAHLAAADVPFQIFGPPMHNWRTHMPKGMHLKSDGFASDLYDPGRRLTLRAYCADRGVPYADLGLPVPVDVFCAYGLAFQSQMVPSLDQRMIVNLERAESGFVLTLDDGQSLQARRVIVATGITHFEYVPEELRSLPPSLCTHSADNHDLARYAGKRVLVLGRGASSTDIAALLLAQGASVEIVSREPVIFHLPPGKKRPSIWHRMRNPNFGLGPNFRSAVYTLLPGVFHLLPQRLRQRVVRRHLGPAAVWFIRDQLVGHVPMHSGYQLQHAEARDGGVRVSFVDRAGKQLDVQADHLICGTGYRVDLQRLPFLGESLRSQVCCEGASPKLSLEFESSVPGLYFVGLASAVSFGPLERFALGAGYTARKISSHLRRTFVPKRSESLISARS
ncbi:MAG: NAD(P)-binding domain-containing protein [Gammaproteobacteria bacterium]